MELQGRLDTVLGGYSILANALLDTELAGEKKRSIGKFLMVVMEFSQVTMDKMLRFHDIFDKVRDKLDSLEK